MPSKTSSAPANDIRLREVIDDDLPNLFEHQHDPEANRMAAFPARERGDFMAHWAKIRSDKDVTIRTILCNGKVAGTIDSWDRDHKRLVGYWIGRAYWGKGVATSALVAFLKVDQTRPLYAFVAKSNIGSIRVLEKSGFTMCREETEALGPPSDGVEEFVFRFSG